MCVRACVHACACVCTCARVCMCACVCECIKLIRMNIFIWKMKLETRGPVIMSSCSSQVWFSTSSKPLHRLFWRDLSLRSLFSSLEYLLTCQLAAMPLWRCCLNFFVVFLSLELTWPTYFKNIAVFTLTFKVCLHYA